MNPHMRMNIIIKEGAGLPPRAGEPASRPRLELAQCESLSSALSMSGGPPLAEKPELLHFGGEMLTGDGLVFNPLPGFHFGLCGDIRVHTPLTRQVRCDMPVVMAYLILDGSFSYRLRGVDAAPREVRGNMFLLGRCHGVDMELFFPVQRNYGHIGFIVREESLNEVVGAAAGDTLRALLDAAPGRGRTGAGLLSGIASPDAVCAARQLRDMQAAGPLDLLCYRCQAMHFFAKLFSQVAAAQAPPPVLLQEQDRRRLAGIKATIERDFLRIGSAAEVCEGIGMSLSKANRGFRALYSMTITQYIQQCRMAHAYACLAARRLNVSECAFEVGYSNVSHFISAFKKQFKLTPKAVARLEAGAAPQP